MEAKEKNSPMEKYHTNKNDKSRKRKKPGVLGVYVSKKLLMKNQLTEKLLLNFICIKVQEKIVQAYLKHAFT